MNWQSRTSYWRFCLISTTMQQPTVARFSRSLPRKWLSIA
ncbi:hypothetical protein L915_10297 [Phytophthora nicotianae]|uniref:Uncharacterized protein n=1 Tax=Phytophthora nicotianae TaxID=4792 RepID=W2IVQ9_PHYNI|nr:hypothetical protein L915_10297 [Phytophthora nicotianae]ETL38201.1 hypothetical protein L916_10199 [Phytophthora nicotianae]